MDSFYPPPHDPRGKEQVQIGKHVELNTDIHSSGLMNSPQTLSFGGRTGETNE